jgi:bisphosphoglycerate-dependent phosphoglycerate mutase
MNWVEDQTLHGITDVPLNKKGKIQANETVQSIRECGGKRIYELD